MEAAATRERRRYERMPRVNFVVALTHHAGIDLAEVGFLLVVIAGVWLVAAEIPQLELDGLGPRLTARQGTE
jgi:hypothetical protein